MCRRAHVRSCVSLNITIVHTWSRIDVNVKVKHVLCVWEGRTSDFECSFFGTNQSLQIQQYFSNMLSASQWLEEGLREKLQKREENMAKFERMLQDAKREPKSALALQYSSKYSGYVIALDYTSSITPLLPNHALNRHQSVPRGPEKRCVISIFLIIYVVQCSAMRCANAVCGVLFLHSDVVCGQALRACAPWLCRNVRWANPSHVSTPRRGLWTSVEGWYTIHRRGVET